MSRIPAHSSRIATHGEHRNLQLAWDAFPTELGWMATLGDGARLRELVFGFRSPRAAADALLRSTLGEARRHDWYPALRERLIAYACGSPDDFRDITIDVHHLTAFQRSVVAACRQIDYGQTQTYGELARAVGHPGAARAVGSVMARNALPLVVPCHRVLATNGGWGGYSAPGGLGTKRRLLQLEAAAPVLA